MGSLSVGQVVLAAFPFSDLTNTKIRPCLVIGIADYDDVVLCQITSKRYNSNLAVPLAVSDFQQGSIAISSYIWPDKLVTLDKSIVKQVLGVISDDKLDEVKHVLRAVFEITGD